MKQKTLQVITALLLIVTLTMANFLLLCVDVVSYAAEQVSLDKKTNHKNIEFMAYFKDENGGRTDKLDATTTDNNLKLFLNVAVNQEGYFNGKVELKNANFNLKPDSTSESIEKIENNTVYLNQIKAGETKEIELNIEIIKDEQFDLSLIDLQSVIALSGVYKDSTQKDISINAEKNVKLRYKNPYVLSKGEVNLSQEVITNKVFTINGEQKRVIQLQLKSLINNDVFPVKRSTINIYAPKISDKYPEKVLVNSNEILLTSGKQVTEKDWNYNKETGIVNVTIENVANNNKVSWIKNGEDSFIVTYIFDKDVELNNEKLEVKSKIEYYDLNKYEISNSRVTTLTKEEKDSIVNDKVLQNEESIYKGKLYAEILRDVSYKNIIDVNLVDASNETIVTENKQKINDKDIVSEYKTSKINKEDIVNVLGQNGNLEIINTETKQSIVTINKDSQSDENGNIVVIYPTGVQSITIKISDQEKVGRIQIETIKTISKINKDELKKASKIEQENTVAYAINNEEKVIGKVNSSIGLQETETSANLEINRTELSTMTKNENVEFRITLNSKNENNELFKNPVLKLELPEKIEGIEINSVKLLYEDEMKIKSYVIKNKTLEIVLDGEQTQYKGEAVDGAIIIVNANITVNMKNPSSKEQVKLTYTNENAVNYNGGEKLGTVQKDINIVSYAGIVSTNKILEYGIEVINNEGNKNGKIDVSSAEKTATVENKIINNNENKISEVKILGTLPTNEATKLNNSNVVVENLSVEGVNSSLVKIYTTNNANATEDLENKENNWEENITNIQNSKKYLVVITELDVLKEVNVKYQITIPANLEYNKVAEEGFNVYYKDAVTNVVGSTKLDNVQLTTGEGPIVEASLKAYVGQNEETVVKEGDVLTYSVTIENTGTEDVTNLKITGNVPENTVYVEKNQRIGPTLEEIKFEPYKEDNERKNAEFNIEKLAVGEKITKTYQVKVKDETAGKNIKNSVSIQYGEVTKTSNEVNNSIEKSDIQTLLYSGDSDDENLKAGYSYRFILKVTNKSNEEKTNLNVDTNIGNAVTLQEISYLNRNKELVVSKDTNNITIDSIKPGETVGITVLVLANMTSNVKDANGTISATVSDGKTKYDSNTENVKVNTMNLDTVITSNKENEYVNAGDEIEYTVTVKNNGTEDISNLLVTDSISNNVTLTQVTRNGENISLDGYVKGNNSTLRLEGSLGSGKQVEYKIKVVVNRIPGNTKSVEIENNIVVSVNENEFNNKTIKNILKPELTTDNTGSENTGDNTNPGNTENNNPDNQNNLKSISGSVWVDENGNGKKDSGEELLKDIKVKLLNSNTNKFVKDSNNKDLEATTNQNGFYSFDSIPNGEYIVIFEYDTSKYVMSKYMAEGIDTTENSKAIAKTITVDGNNYTIGATEVIKLNSDNVPNVNMGLQVAKNADLKLDKYISKVIIQNSKGTVTDEYENISFAKAEIDAKLVNSTTAVVEYTIKVTNVGEVDAYVSKIADYISKDYKFTSELNKDWYQSGDVLYNNSLSNEKIKPGESKQITLTVTKQMKDSNTGLINNTAEIVESHNELGINDNNENNKNSADLIISIKTGQVVTTVTVVLSTIVIIGVITYLVAGFVLRKRII